MGYISQEDEWYIYKREGGAGVVEDECAICLMKVGEDAESQMASNNTIDDEGERPSQLEYFETPCKHKYHEKCLRDWVKVKLECPKCRARIPPIDPPPQEVDNDDEY